MCVLGQATLHKCSDPGLGSKIPETHLSLFHILQQSEGVYEIPEASVKRYSTTEAALQAKQQIKN